jgi:hypothetical protein
VPLSPQCDYLLESTAYSRWRGNWFDSRWSTRVVVRAAGEGLLAVFDAEGQVDAASDAHGDARNPLSPPGGMPPGAPAKASLVRVCVNGTKEVDVSGALGLRLVFDAANTVTNLGYAEVVDRPKNCGHPVTWSSTPPDVEPDGVDARADADDKYRALVSVQWWVEPGEHRVYARCEHGCFEGSGPIEIASVVRIGLDVTDEFGTGGPDGDLDDPGDNLGSYLPGETLHGGPVIKLDSTEKRLVPQSLSLRVETEGDVPYTGVVFRISGVTTKPGWCTNTRDPNDEKEEKDYKANWDPHDFSLSEAGYLAQTNAPIVDGVAAVDLFCRDYGGTCKVYADLQCTNGTLVTRSFTIPFDSDSDGIADRWETDAAAGWASVFGTNAAGAATALFGVGGVQEPADPDGPELRAAHASEGDGITASEEYRGFSLPGTVRAHRRFSPIRKEMVVWVQPETTNGVGVATPAALAATMEAVRDVFERDLGIDFAWVRAAPRERVDPGSGTLEDVVAGNLPYDEDFGHPLHTAAKARRFLVTTGLPPGKDHLNRPGAAHGAIGRAAVLDVGFIADSMSPSNPWPLSAFLRSLGVTLVQRLVETAVHEAGHMAGCAGDRRLVEPGPALRVGAQGSYAGGRDIVCRFAKLGDEVLLTVKRADKLEPDIELVVFDPGRHLTVAELAAAVDAHSNYVAQALAPHTGVPAMRLHIDGVEIPQASGSLADVAVEAELNGIMSYNVWSPGRHLSPAFDNDAATAQAGPRAELYSIEVGSVSVVAQ